MNSRLLLGEWLPEPDRWEILSDSQAMRLAIQEAFKGAGQTSPNPIVGCVVLDGKNRFLAKGFHEVLGGPHAEVNALKELTDADVKGAKVYVTLEPCAHSGKSPSCAKALATLPLQQVIFGLFDPNPLVAGQGAQILHKAGIRVASFVANPELAKIGIEFHLKDVSTDVQQEWVSLLEQTCEHFLWNFRKQAPFVSIKVASSLDGQMALKNGESKWITCEESRVFAHYLRASHEAILVGAGTLLTDNPKLDVRHPRFQNKVNKVVVLDSQGRCLRDFSSLNILKVHQPENLIFLVGPSVELKKQKETILNSGVKVVNIGTAELNASVTVAQPLDPQLILQQLWQLNIKSILVEGGAKVISSFIRAQLAQRLYVFTAPIIMGAKNGRSWTEDLATSSMKDRIALSWHRTQEFGEDHLFTGRF